MENEIKAEGTILGKFTSDHIAVDTAAETILGLQLGEDGAPFLVGFSSKHTNTFLDWKLGDKIEMIFRRKE